MSETAPTPTTAEQFTFDDPGLWTRFQSTPWRDLVCGRSWGKLDHRPLIAAAELPASLKTLVNDVVTRTRLWPKERQSVAQDLCNHFIDGLAAGASPEQLTQDFGNPETAACLIRRAKDRCRPWAWHVLHRTRQVALGLVLLLIGVWAVLAIRFGTAQPTVTIDPIAQADKKSHLIPEDKRAWTYYRQGLVKINRRDLSIMVDGKSVYMEDIMEAGPTHEQWPLARAYLGKMGETIRLFLEGTEQIDLGFIHRDPGNEAWRRWDVGQGWETYNEPGTAGPLTLLAHGQEMRTVFHFLQGALHIAIEDADGQRAVDIAVGELRLAGHARQSHDGFIADLIGFVTLRSTLQTISQMILQHPDLLTNAQLTQLEDRVSTALETGPITYHTAGELAMWLDYLQRIYTDDGHRNGRITPEGLKIVAENSQGIGSEWLPYVRPSSDANLAEDLSTMLAGSAVATMIADRRSMERKLRELHELWQLMLADPDTDPADSAYSTTLNEMMEQDRTRYLPYLAVIGRDKAQWYSKNPPARRLIAVNAEREATLVAIALERFRRETGHWPTSWDDVVPQFLEKSPSDPYAEDQPLMYRIVDGQPQVWSVGPNQTFDDFTPPQADTTGWNADTGDWRLIPPEQTLY